LRSNLTFSIRENLRQVASQPNLRSAKCNSTLPFFAPNVAQQLGLALYLLYPRIFLHRESSRRDARKRLIEFHSALS
jgi:hypothetical protein